jgi:ribose/xylose/arabinose/galactoside ABC-type transport system permease subunit
MQLAMTKAKASLRRYNQLFLLVAVLVIATAISRGVFMRPANLMVVTASAAAFGLVAMSISAIVFFRSDFGIVGGTAAALAAVTAAGLISGVFVSRTKIPPFIVTLGMLSVADSMSWILAAGQPITVPEYNDAISPLFESFPLGENVFPIMVLVLGFIATSVLLHRSKWGRYIYAIGDNEAAARIAGVPVMRTKLLCYGLSGLLCAVGAIVYLYQNISATPGEGSDYLLLSFAATILGGVYMYGGEGTIPGVLVGVICLASITSALTIAGVPPSIYQGVLGTIVLAVVLFQARLRK